MPPSGPPATDPPRWPQALGGVATQDEIAIERRRHVAILRTVWTPR
jgi:hypothetical protein